MKFKANSFDLNHNYKTNSLEITLSIDKTDTMNVKSMLDDKSLKDDLIVEIKKFRKARSKDQNSLLWEIITLIANSVNLPTNELYKQFIKDYGFSTIMPVKNELLNQFVCEWEQKGLGSQAEIIKESKFDGYTNVKLYFGSSGYDTKQFSLLLDGIMQEADNIGVDIAYQSKELKSLLEQENEKQTK